MDVLIESSVRKLDEWMGIVCDADVVRQGRLDGLVT